MKFYSALSSLFLLFLFINNGCSSSSGTSTDDKNREVINPEVIERDFLASLKIKSISKTEFLFDENGNLSGHKKLSDEELNERGFRIRFKTYNDNSTPEYDYTYEYDKNGRRIRSNCFNGQNLIRYYKYLYDESGFKLKTECYNSDNFLIEYYEYEYDDKGRLTSENWYNKNDVFIQKIVYEYDGFRKKSIETFDGNDDLIYRYELNYDNNNLLIEEVKYDQSDRKTGVIQYIYRYR